MKRVVDIVLSAAGLVILAPVFLVLAAIVKLTSRGPVIYRSSRVGRDGKPFTIIKFRTMIPNAEYLGGAITTADDPRLTPTGRFLRRYKLDELPQLVNVLSGDMSLVGPRPEVQKFVDLYTEEEKAILTLAPGITDWASLWNSDEDSLLEGWSDPERVYLEMIRPEKLRLQMEYVRRRSFWVDMSILGETVWTLGSRMLGRDSLPPAIRENSFYEMREGRNLDVVGSRMLGRDSLPLAIRENSFHELRERNNLRVLGSRILGRDSLPPRIRDESFQEDA